MKKYLAYLGCLAILISAWSYYLYADTIGQAVGITANRYSSSSVPTTTWNWLRDSHADAITARGVLATNGVGFNGTTYDRLRFSSAANLTQTVSLGIQSTSNHSTWSATNTPAADTQATASRAAGAAGIRHVPTHVTACISGTAVAAPVQVNLRDGATGAGTIIWSAFLGVDTINANSCVSTPITLPPGTAATAMTLEFAAAGGVGTNETVTLSGFSVQ